LYVLNKLKHEFLSLLPPTIFFFITFSLMVVSKQLILKEYNVPFSGWANALIGALIVGKVVLLTDMLRFVNRFPDKPLMYNVAWKTSIYFIATMLFRYVEHIAPLLMKSESLAQAHSHLMEEIVWPHFWLIHMWLVVLFFVYCSVRELVRVLGKREILALFFG